MSILHEVGQGTAEWQRLRLGIPTASQFGRIITPAGKPSAQSTGYRNQLVAERLLLEPFGRDIGHLQYVEHGKAYEAIAAQQFEFLETVQLEPAGFFTTDDGRLGCSPDRLIMGKNRREAVEIKCPQPPNHLGYLLDGPGTDYRAQVQGQLLIGDFEAVHFYSYHPQCPAYHCVTYRDNAYLRVLAQLLRDFCDELDRATEQAKTLGAFLPQSA